MNTPDDLIQPVYIPIEDRCHDWKLHVKRDLEENLPEVLVINGELYCVYFDNGYSLRWFLEIPYQRVNLTPGQHIFNTTMSHARITVQWIFRELKLYSSTRNFKRKLKLKQSPIKLLCSSAMMLCNVRSCIYYNLVLQCFDLQLPSLESNINET